MSNPFKYRSLSPAGPATDISLIVPDDNSDFPDVAVALYVESGGAITITTEAGQTRTVQVADFSILPVAVRRLRATGTTATGVHAMVLV